MNNQDKIKKLQEIINYLKLLSIPSQEEINSNYKRVEEFINEKIMWVFSNIRSFNTLNSEDRITEYSLFMFDETDEDYYKYPFGLITTENIYNILSIKLNELNIEEAKNIISGVACVGDELKNYKYLAYEKYCLKLIRSIDLNYLILLLQAKIDFIIKKLSKQE